MKVLKIVAVVVMGMMLVAGCAKAPQRSALTAGMAKKFIYPHKTTQVEVMEIFGPPDLVTHKSGKEVWTYDKINSEVISSSGFLTIFIAGYSRSNTRSSNISTMLIVYFDGKEVVEDYAMSVSKF